ncbi:MAG: porin, partial [Prevotella sp.]|nr:porin [Prevotella sp.]
PNKSGRNLLHYQVGVFNGQGINTKDVDNQKDVIGGVWVMPVSGMRLGVFGWTGSYARNGENGVKKLSKRRYAISGEYVVNDWTFRSEYIHSTGYAFKTVYNEKSDLSADEIDYSKGDKADGVYALVIAPVINNKVHVKARYDLYRQDAKWDQAKTYYELGADYVFMKHLQISAEYALVNDRTLNSHNYSMADVQVSFRF